MLQSIAWQVTLACVVVLLLLFGFVALNAGSKAEGAADKVTRARGWVFWALVVVFVPIIGYSLGGLPYFPPSGSSAQPLTVTAIGRQWRWDIDPVQVPAGQPIEFHVTSDDVNHGFAIYDSELKIVAQTQAMPGFTNVLHVNFDKAGAYRVLCLEYCGLAHHKMMTEITVTDSK